MSLPKVSIIITTYKEETKPYLDLAVESVNNISYPKDKLEKIVVSKKSYMPEYPEFKTIAPEPDEFFNPLACNYSISKCSKDSEFIFIVNDDVILTKNCLQPLVEQGKAKNCILLPIGNCHLRWKYSLIMGYQDGNEFKQITKRFNRLPDFLPIKDKLMNTDSIYPPGLLLEKTLCLYAALYPRELFDRVGLFDEQFTVGQDDIDFCLRASQLGYANVICLNSLVWHFGGATSSSRSDKLRQENIDRFIKKWGFPPFLN